jgi:hypothetical protein
MRKLLLHFVSVLLQLLKGHRLRPPLEAVPGGRQQPDADHGAMWKKMGHLPWDYQ